jgi:hypothetical protein
MMGTGEEGDDGLILSDGWEIDPKTGQTFRLCCGSTRECLCNWRDDTRQDHEANQ